MFDKPKHRKINVANLKAEMVEGWQKTSSITKLVCKEMRVVFDQDINDKIDGHAPMFFLVLKNREYDVAVPGKLFLDFLFENGLNPDNPPVETAKYKACRKHEVKYLVKQHMKIRTNPPKPALGSFGKF